NDAAAHADRAAEERRKVGIQSDDKCNDDDVHRAGTRSESWLGLRGCIENSMQRRKATQTGRRNASALGNKCAISPNSITRFWMQPPFPRLDRVDNSLRSCMLVAATPP